MAKVTVTTTNKIKRARPRLLNGLDRGLILSAKVVAQDATQRAPIDTGRLKRSITHGTPFSADKGRGILIGTNVEYARFQEEGTKNMAAQPYLKPALEAKKEIVSVIILKSIVGALKGT